jgi:hypothetical protein
MVVCNTKTETICQVEQRRTRQVSSKLKLYHQSVDT